MFLPLCYLWWLSAWICVFLSCNGSKLKFIPVRNDWGSQEGLLHNLYLFTSIIQSKEFKSFTKSLPHYYHNSFNNRFQITSIYLQSPLISFPHKTFIIITHSGFYRAQKHGRQNCSSQCQLSPRRLAIFEIKFCSKPIKSCRHQSFSCPSIPK